MPHESLFLGTGETLGGVLTVCIHYKLPSFGKQAGSVWCSSFFREKPSGRQTRISHRKIDGALVDPVELNQPKTAGHRKLWSHRKKEVSFRQSICTRPVGDTTYHKDVASCRDKWVRRR